MACYTLQLSRNRLFMRLLRLKIKENVRLFVLAICTITPNAQASNDIPEGFEQLAMVQETMVDVYYQGRFLRSVDAQFSVGNIIINSPDEVINAIDNLKSKTDVLNAISGELSSNQQAICASDYQTNCGTLTPSIAGVIFDESQFRLDLFINPEYLTISNKNTDIYLPKSNAGLSLIQNFGAAYTAQLNKNNDYTIFGTTTLAYEETNLQASWDFSGKNGGRIDTLFIQKDYRGRDVKAGLFRPHSQNLSFAPQQSIAGIRIASSQQTRTDLDVAQSNDIQVFLNTRAQIDIVKEGRLLNSGMYAPGNQLVDTQHLPNGAYNITLRINEENGTTRIETRYFVKEYDLPANKEIEYFFEAGDTLDGRDKLLPTSNGNTIIRGGIRFRLRDDLGAGISSTWHEGTGLLESSFVSINSFQRVRANVMVSNDGDYGYSLSNRLQWRDLSATFESRKLWRKNNAGSNQVAPLIIDPLFNQPQLLSDQQHQAFSLLPKAFSQHQLNLNIPFYKGHLSYSATLASQSGLAKQTIQNISYTRNFSLESRDNISMRIGASHDGQHGMMLLSVNYRMNQGNWTHSVTPEMSTAKRSGQQKHSLRVRSSTLSKSKDGSDLRNAFYATLSDNNNIGWESSYASRYGRANLNVERGFSNDAGTRMFANASSSFISNFEDIAWGGRDVAGSAVLVGTSGQTKDMSFDILIDGYKRDTISANNASVLQLTPFETYKVRLRPTGTRLVGFSDKEQEITLYPGNVVPVRWEVNPIVIGFGRIVGRDGKAIKNVAIDGAFGVAFTDQYGIFQAELLTTSDYLQINNNDYNCKVALPKVEERKSNIQNLGSLTCQ